MLEEEISKRLGRVEDELTYHIRESSNDHRRTEKRLRRIEEAAASRKERLDQNSRQIKNLAAQIERMETGLLAEFKISQEIMKAMLEHDMGIERAKFDLKSEMERKQKEHEQAQKAHEMQMKAERKKFRRDLYIKLGAVALPILTALASGIAFLIQNLFK